MDVVGVGAVDECGMGDEFGHPNSYMLGTDVFDGAGDDFAGDRVAVAEEDFVSLAQFRGVDTPKFLLPFAVASWLWFADWLKVADGGAAFDALREGDFPEEGLLLLGFASFD